MSHNKLLRLVGRNVLSVCAAAVLSVASPMAMGQLLYGVFSTPIAYAGECGDTFATWEEYSSLDGTYTPGTVKSISRTGTYTNPFIWVDHRCSMSGQFSATYETLQASLESQAIRNAGQLGFLFQAYTTSGSSDRIRVLSKSLPTGTPVTLSLIWEMNWSGAVSVSANNQVDDPEMAANPCFMFVGGGPSGSHILTACTYPQRPEDIKLTKAGRRVVVQTLSAIVGDWISLITELSLSSMPQVSGADLSHAATSMSTTLKGKTGPYAEAKVYLAVPAGVRLQADSGFKYRCPAKFAECAATH